MKTAEEYAALAEGELERSEHVEREGLDSRRIDRAIARANVYALLALAAPYEEKAILWEKSDG